MTKPKQPEHVSFEGDIELYNPVLHERHGHQGQKVIETDCRAYVFKDWWPHQCRVKGKYKEHGYQWCKRHLPSNAQGKIDARRNKWAKELAISKARSDRMSKFNDIARVTIDYFDQLVSFDEVEKVVLVWREAKAKHDELKGTET